MEDGRPDERDLVITCTDPAERLKDCVENHIRLNLTVMHIRKSTFLFGSDVLMTYFLNYILPFGEYLMPTSVTIM